MIAVQFTVFKAQLKTALHSWGLSLDKFSGFLKVNWFTIYFIPGTSRISYVAFKIFDHLECLAIISVVFLKLSSEQYVVIFIYCK